MEEQEVFAYEFEGIRYDAGTTMGWLKASVELALQRPELGPEFRTYLAGPPALAARREPRTADCGGDARDPRHRRDPHRRRRCRSCAGPWPAASWRSSSTCRTCSCGTRSTSAASATTSPSTSGSTRSTSPPSSIVALRWAGPGAVDRGRALRVPARRLRALRVDRRADAAPRLPERLRVLVPARRRGRPGSGGRLVARSAGRSSCSP